MKPTAIAEYIAEELKNNQVVSIIGLGTFTLKDRRQGQIYGNIGIDKKPKYQKRVSFKPCVSFKNKINNL